MQPHDSDGKCPEAGAGDGGRNPERRAMEAALGVAIALLRHMAHRPVRVAEPGGTVDLSARLVGRGGTRA